MRAEGGAEKSCAGLRRGVACPRAEHTRDEQLHAENAEVRGSGGLIVDHDAVSYTHLTLPTICSV